MKRRYTTRVDWPSVLKRALEEGKCAADIASEVGCHRTTVHYAAHRYGVALASGRRGPGAASIDWHPHLMRAILDGTSANQFCFEHDICFETLRRIERRYGAQLPRRKARSAEGARA